MFRGIGTVINVCAVVAGGFIGMKGGSRLSLRSRTLITDVLGCVTLLGAADAAKSLWSLEFSQNVPGGWTLLGTLAALLLGGLLGTAAGIEEKLENFGNRLKERFGGEENSFIAGFMAASLLFVIGPLAIMGSISDGMGTGITQLVLKSTLDFFAAIAFASTFGFGVIASAIPVGIYQGAWTLVGFFLGNIMDKYQIEAMTTVGGILLFGISLRLLGIKQIRIGDLLPSLFLAPFVALLAHQFL